MSYSARQHRHVAFECILRDRRIELEVRYQVSCDAVFLQLGNHLPKDRYTYAARKSFAKFRYSYNWLSPDLPCSSPNDSSISSASTRISKFFRGGLVV